MSLDNDVRWTLPKLQRRIALVAGEIHRLKVPLPVFSIQMLDYVGPLDQQRSDPAPSAWTEIHLRSSWGDWRMSFVLRTTFAAPADWTGKGPISLLLDIGEAGDFAQSGGARLCRRAAHCRLRPLPPGNPSARRCRRRRVA